MKIGFIGIGNMATAIIEGIENKNNIYISGSSWQDTKLKASKLRVNPCKNHLECLEQVDYLVFAIKPELFDEVLPIFKDQIGDQCIISIAAKKTISDIEKILGHVPIIRVMPNLNASIKESMNGICSNNLVTDKDLNKIKNLFNGIGPSIILKEKQMSDFVALAGSSPAFVFQFIDTLAHAVENIDYDDALKIVIQSVKGSALYLKESGIPADTLIERVCSPNGTTIEGVKALNHFGFNKAIKEAAKATILKDKKG